MIRVWSFLLISSLALAAAPAREMVYSSAITMGGHDLRHDKGYLVYLHQPNRLEVHRPDGKLAYNFDLPCPGEASRSAAAAGGKFQRKRRGQFWLPKQRESGA